MQVEQALILTSLVLTTGALVGRYVIRPAVRFFRHIGDFLADWRGQDPQPGMPQRMTEVEIAVRDVQGVVTNGLSVNAARAVDLAERAELAAAGAKVEAAEAKLAARAAAEQVVDGMDELHRAVSRLSQRIREQNTTTEEVLQNVPTALWDTLAEHLRREDEDEGADGSV